MKIQEDIFNGIVLKNDLQYVLDEKEHSLFLKMTSNEVSCIRERILKSIQNKDLSLDVLEDYLMHLKDLEYHRYLDQEGNLLDFEMQLEHLAELEGKCTQMIINIAKGNVGPDSLLGPSIHDTYGIGVKS